MSSYVRSHDNHTYVIKYLMKVFKASAATTDVSNFCDTTTSVAVETILGTMAVRMSMGKL